MRNLHVVFTMNPSANGLRDRASTSPALFNRCVLDWFGDWSLDAYYHVASELTQTVPMEKSEVIDRRFPVKKKEKRFRRFSFSTSHRKR